MISKIRAKYDMVEIVSPDGSTLISRKEALMRAKAVIGMDKEAADLVEALVLAANEAKINETGKPYDSRNLELMIKTAREESNKIK
jgi:hypothetical protein